MDERLKLAEAYYQVAADLRDNGRRMIDTADLLSSTADRMCEANMREKQPDSASTEQTK